MEKMKTYLVFDVPASSGGALTILNQYYEKAVNDEKNNWIFIISTPELKETKNIKILSYPWIKKSWFHRAWFDLRFEKKILRKYEYAELITLQNVPLKTKRKHTIYLHNALLFYDVKFNFFTEFKNWLYNKITRIRIKRGLKNKHNQIIVQTNWMKKFLVLNYSYPKEKVRVIKPKLNEKTKNYKYTSKQGRKTFFYPADFHKFKNHEVIIKALLEIKRGYNYEVIFTIDETNKKAKKIVKTVNKHDLPIKFIGQIKYDKVLELYQESTLIFPSYLESFGLPLLEAKTIGSPIIASKKDFSIEILENYDNVTFFDPFDKDELVKILNQKLEYHKNLFYNEG